LVQQSKPKRSAFVILQRGHHMPCNHSIQRLLHLRLRASRVALLSTTHLSQSEHTQHRQLSIMDTPVSSPPSSDVDEGIMDGERDNVSLERRVPSARIIAHLTSSHVSSIGISTWRSSIVSAGSRRRTRATQRSGRSRRSKAIAARRTGEEADGDH
jgi:hypothetical protein